MSDNQQRSEHSSVPGIRCKGVPITIAAGRSPTPPTTRNAGDTDHQVMLE